MNDTASQSLFQVRFDWGHRGAAAISPGAHVLVWCDALPTGTAVPAFDGALLSGTTGNAQATARWILDLQTRIGDRVMVAVVAAGTDDAWFAVEDFLAAGAVIDALAAIGLDFNSPEAASACAAYEGLRNATVHLTTASVTGRSVPSELLAAAKQLNAAPEAIVLQELSA